MNKHEARIILVALAVGAAAATVGIVAVKVARKRRKKHIIPKKVRTAMAESLEAAGADVAANHKVVGAAFQKRVGKLSDKQLIALYAAVKVGGLVKDAGFGFDEADSGQKAWVKSVFAKEQNDAPQDRASLLDALGKLPAAALKDALSVIPFVGDKE